MVVPHRKQEVLFPLKTMTLFDNLPSLVALSSHIDMVF